MKMNKMISVTSILAGVAAAVVIYGQGKRISRLEKETEDTLNNIDKINDKKRELELELDMKDCSIQGLESKIDELLGTIACMQDELINSSDSDIDSPDDTQKLKDALTQNEELELRLTQQREKIKELKGQIRDSTSNAESYKNEIIDLKEQLRNIVLADIKERDSVRNVARALDKTSKKISKDSKKKKSK